MEMDADVWHGLPPEVMEQVLSFLPAIDLCRQRLVCKRWHFLISQPSFGALWLRNANHAPNFIVARFFFYDRTATCNAEPSEIESGVSLFDLETRRWYKVREHGTHPFRDGLISTGTWAMDGGLICQHKTLPAWWDKPIVVYNPIADTKKNLPPAPVHNRGWGRDYSMSLNMAVDFQHGYNVFLFCSGELEAKSPLMLVYNSSTEAWVCSTRVYPACSEGYRRCKLTYLCSVMFRGLLHVFVRLNFEYRLWSYDVSRDVWEDVGVRIQAGCTFCSPELVVAGDRLFLVTWTLLDVDTFPTEWRLEVSEIVVPGGVCKPMLQMSHALVLQVFGAESEGYVINRKYNFGNPHLNVFGYRESIILMSMKSGVTMAYDIASHSWDLLPRNPSGPLPGEKDYMCYAKQMSLLLPCVQW